MAPATGNPSDDNPVLALILRIAGIAAFGTMAMFIKLASESGIHIVEIVFWRQAVSVPILLGWAMLAGGLSTLRTARPRSHAIRAGYGLVGMAFNFGGVILLPLAEATTFNFTSSIWAVILSATLLGEHVGKWRWSAVIAGFAGVLVIAQPGGGHVPLVGALVALGGAFMLALISIQIRDLSRTDKPMVIVFWFAFTSVVVTAPVLPFVATEHTSTQWLILLGIGLAGTAGQVLVTLALRYGEVSSVIVMDYSGLIWATLYGWLIFATLPTVWTWLGAPLVVLAGIIITWRESILRRRRLRDRHEVIGG
ncbi:DMT family transporter [Aurantiacibacter spongiae]|uniref:DMT family transporter n=1 Tax=Aurantiacibacter spongiae TaxID=2488860 RepID=UPI001F3D136C|nr:DMT family transporter [Aurantiacibacter spongiae]